MGLLEPSAWQARWIAAPPVEPVVPPHFGYMSAVAKRADAVKWVQIDLGESQRIDGVRLWPAEPFFFWNRNVPGDGFPVRFKIEVSNDPAFASATMLLDRTAEDVLNPKAEPLELKASTLVNGRYVRLTATRLFEGWHPAWGNYQEFWEHRPRNTGYYLLSLPGQIAGLLLRRSERT
jgi:hypothetical protein